MPKSQSKDLWVLCLSPLSTKPRIETKLSTPQGRLPTPCLSPLSTKPRIETLQDLVWMILLLCLSPLSTKPRIETSFEVHLSFFSLCLSPLSTKPRIETLFQLLQLSVDHWSKSFIH